jgi:hypothetical protein
MDENEAKFLATHWSDGEITIALDREYTPEQVEEL